ncbi:hypothetical protein CN958_16460 [Bacillus cereus]|uniref:Uncharacterized protein n=1 Tax=Bacillus cereus TaxID=1396 RepID=A0A2B9DY82_BACCE|nr:hypothetical protein CN958_16460 [Bacillus cereus]
MFGKSYYPIIQGPFARATIGHQSEILIGESGLITALIILITAIIVSRIPSGMDDNRRPNTTC